MRRSLVCLAALLGLACDTLEPPAREPSYPFTDFSSGNLVFRWTPDRLPVRYVVLPGAEAVRDDVEAALRAWERELLFGEFRGVIVSDSTTADALIRLTARNDVNPALACRGVTMFDVVGSRLTRPFVVTLTWQEGAPAAEVEACLRRITIHEIGHTLGLFAHSDSATDIMAGNPTVQALSLRDRRTFERLYHTTPELGPPVREEPVP